MEKISDRVTSNKSNHLLVKNELKGKNYSEGNDGGQNALVFQTMQKHFDLRNGDEVSRWKSKELSNQYLGFVGATADVVLSKLIKPMHAIFKEKGALVQYDNDFIQEGQ